MKRVVESQEKPRRRWFQFSLRTLMVFMTMVGIGAGQFGHMLNVAHRQHDAVLAIKAAGGYAAYEHEFEEYGDMWGADFEPPEPKWFWGLFPPDMFRQVWSVGQGSDLGSVTRDAVRGLRLDRIRGLTLQRDNSNPDAIPLTDADVRQWPLSSMTGLRALSAPETGVRDNTIRQLRKLYALKDLRLHGARITDAGMAHLAALKNMKSLSLIRTDVSDEGIRHLARMGNLRKLYLRDTLVTGSGFGDLTNLHQLEYLYMNRTPANDASVAHMVHLDLRRLEISETLVADSGAGHLSRLKHLRHLDLGNTKITGQALSHFKNSQELRFLSVAGANVRDADLVHLHNIPKLESLNLEYTLVTDAAIEQLAKRKWKLLRLKGTQMTPAGFAKLQQLLPDCHFWKF